MAREDAIGRSVFEVLYRQPSDRMRSEIEEVFESNEVRHYEVESTASGEPRFYRLTKVPMRLAGTHEVTHVITIGEDITEQKRITERIAHAEKLVALGQMAAGVMHEINNPLATIAASAEVLRESSEPHSEEMEYVSMIETEVDRCKRIAAIAVSTVPLPVTMMTSGDSSRFIASRSTPIPSTSGMTRSTRATSNSSVFSRSIAARLRLRHKAVSRSRARAAGSSRLREARVATGERTLADAPLETGRIPRDHYG